MKVLGFYITRKPPTVHSDSDYRELLRLYYERGRVLDQLLEDLRKRDRLKGES